MLYTSFLRPRGPGVLWSYAPDAGSIAVGSTGGGVQVGGIGDVPPLDWGEFSRDLRLARRWSDDVHVFSLEGCVRQGFLARLRDFDWHQPVVPPSETAGQVEMMRQVLRAILWLSARPLVLLFGLLAVLWLLSHLRRAPRCKPPTK